MTATATVRVRYTVFPADSEEGDGARPTTIVLDDVPVRDDGDGPFVDVDEGRERIEAGDRWIVSDWAAA